ncbi:hypothetical protein AAG906_004959 [Vitis piasezkii]
MSISPTPPMPLTLLPQPPPVPTRGNTIFASSPGNCLDSSSFPFRDMQSLNSCPNSSQSHEHLHSNSNSHNNPLSEPMVVHDDHHSDPPLPSSHCIHIMTTRSMNNIHKPKQFNSVTKHPLPPTIEPTCVGQALREPHWRHAMSDELTALMHHGTWDLVSAQNCNPVGCKWIFHVKRNSDGSVDRFKARLVAKGFNQREEQLNFFLGMKVISTKFGFFLSQHKYIRDLLSKTNMIGAKDVSTPLSTTTSLKLVDGTSSTNNTEFRSVIGALQYLSLTKPNISFSSSKRQRAMTRSSTEAKYRALANAASETSWLLSLFKELGLPLSGQPKLLCDNLGATHLSFNPVQHSRMKHIQIDLHFVRDMVQSGVLNVHHVNT